MGLTFCAKEPDTEPDSCIGFGSLDHYWIPKRSQGQCKMLHIIPLILTIKSLNNSSSMTRMRTHAQSRQQCSQMTKPRLQVCLTPTPCLLAALPSSKYKTLDICAHPCCYGWRQTYADTKCISHTRTITYISSWIYLADRKACFPIGKPAY